MQRKSFRTLVFSVLAAWPFLASASDLAVVGTGDGIEILKALAGAFNRLEKSNEVTIPPSIGSGGGIAAVGAGKLATSTQEAIETVRLVDGAIGFGPFTKMLEHGTLVLKVDGHHPTDAGYPSSVVLAFIHTEATVTADATAFMSFAASTAGKDIIRSFGGVPAN
jgi:hypothetical protein